MRLSLKAIGLTTALLLGTHIDAHLDLLNDQGSLVDSETTHEIRALDSSNKEASLASSVGTTGTSTQDASTETIETTPAEEVVEIEEVNPSSRTAELKASLSEIGKALKEGTLAAAQVLNGFIDLATPVINIAISVVSFGASLAKLVWFGGKAIYTAGLIFAEGSQTAYAYLTK